MTTPTPPLTAVTDPNNVMWVVDVPAPTSLEETTASAKRGPKMTAYRTLLASLTAATDPDFKETTVKRDSKGRFAKKAGVKAAAPSTTPTAPAAAAPVSGKKMTNKVIYGKHPNGTIIASTDGQHRMVFNAAGNNWTVQRRTPDGGWEVVDVLGKGAAYKKANELSNSWGDPHDGTAQELAPVTPTVTPSGPFAPGWNDLAGAGISDFKRLQILTSANTQIPNPETMSPGLMVQHIANMAQTYNVAPEHIVALMDEQRGDTLVSDKMKNAVGGGAFPPPIYPTAAATKKAAAATKTTAKKISAKKAAAPPKTFNATNAPATLALNGEPFNMGDLAVQATDSAKIAKLREELDKAYASGDTILGDQLLDKYDLATQSYQKKYGSPWTKKHGTKVAEAYQKAIDPSPSPAPTPPSAPSPTSTPSTSATPGGPLAAVANTTPGANAGVGVGAQVKLGNGDVGHVLGTSTTGDGSPGLLVNVAGGTAVVVPLSEPALISDTAVEDLKNAPSVGSKIDVPGQGTFTVMGGVKVGASGALYVKTMSAGGKTVWKKISDLNKAAAAAPTPTAAPSTPGTTPISMGPKPIGVGDNVHTPDGEGVVLNASPDGSAYMVTFPDTGVSLSYPADDITLMMSAPPATASTPHAPGTAVSTMYGNGTIISAVPGGKYSVAVDGKTVTLPDGDISPITSASPALTPPTPPAPPAMTYDANGVPVLSPAQQHALQVQFQGSGVNWYNSSEALFDAAYAASHATGMSIEDVLKYADANFHNSSKDGGKPIQTKVAKWAKSSKGKAHMQATMGTAAAAPLTSTPPITPSGAPSAPTTPGGASAANVANVSALKKAQALSQFTSGMVTLTDSPQSLAQKASDVANNLGLTPEQVLAIVDEKKAGLAGVPNGNLFENKVMGHLAGKPFPAPTPTLPAATPLSVPGVVGSSPFPPNPNFPVINTSQATQLQANMELNTPPPWTSTQRSAIVNYTGPGYKDMNNCLRFGTSCTPSVKTRINRASEAMRPTTEPITTFRGTNLAMFGVSDVSELEGMVGGTVREPGFSSTSINPGSAFGGDVAMQIEIPAGTPGAYVANVSAYPGEQEFLLPPGTRFRIIEVVHAHGNARVRVEVVPA